MLLRFGIASFLSLVIFMISLLVSSQEVHAQVRAKTKPLPSKPSVSKTPVTPSKPAVVVVKEQPKLMNTVDEAELALMLDFVKRVPVEHGLYLSLNEEQMIAQISAETNMESIRSRLTPLFISIARQLMNGKLTPTEVGPDIRFQKKTIAEDKLRQLVAEAQGSTEQLVKLLSSQMPEYRMLVVMLAKLREQQKTAAWGPIGKFKKPLKLGVQDAVVPQLKARLRALGYAITSLDNKYDTETEAAVADVQLQLKFNPDKVVSPGGATIAYLEMPIESRIEQVRADLEKIRWLPQDPKDKYIFVNLAFSTFLLMDRSQANPVVFNFRTINGRVERKTPSMVDRIYQVILNPFWTVPPTVFLKDKVEILKNMSSWEIQDWFDRNNFSIVSENGRHHYDPTSINWFAIDSANVGFYIKQSPNYYNALGVVKFALTNGEAIYLHDTGERELFKESNRLRSSGCVRVEKPVDLAEYLLDGTKWTRSELEDYLIKPEEVGNEETAVPLKVSMPVYLLPLTSHLASDNVMRFTSDVYGHNESIKMQVQSRIF